MKFKTNARCAGCEAAIIDALKQTYPEATYSMDLNSADKVLTISGINEDHATIDKIVSIVTGKGFACSLLS